jgi:hypothetical protein
MNPNAIGLMICGASTGYVFGELHGAAIGLAITSGIMFLIGVVLK